MCVFFASGRTVAYDSRSQLTEAAHFCATGHIAARHKLSGDFIPKNFDDNAGVWYDANDVGGTLLVLPAACLSALFGASNPHHTTSLTTLAKSASSLTFALVGGVGVAFLFLTLARMLTTRRAWWWTVAFVFTTAYLAYVKGVWNVLPASAAIAGLMYAVSLQFPERTLPRLAGREPPPARPPDPGPDRDSATDPTTTGDPGRILYGSAAAVGIACLFRYSLGPFLIAAAVIALLPSIRQASRRQMLLALAILFACLLPDLWFNQLRTGRFWVPGEAAPQWEPLHITGHYLVSTLGMFFGVQRGLLFYAPACLLGYLAVVVLIWRTRGAARLTWTGVLICGVAYAVTVVLLHNWFVYGWGPRYLVPLMPPLFVAAVIACESRAIPRAAAYFAVAMGLVTQLPVAFTNWHALLSIVGVQERAPNGIVGLWRSFLHGVASGHSLGNSKTHRALQVPDTWWWHALGHNPPEIVGVVIAAAGLAALLLVGARRAHAAPDTRAA